MIWNLLDLRYKNIFNKNTLLEEYKKNREAISKTSSDWYIYEEIYEKASNGIGITIDPLILYDKLLEIYRYPDQNIELIRMILDL